MCESPQDLIAGGTESSSVTVEWAMSELLRNSGILRKAMQELDGVTGRLRWVEEKDISNLPYIDGIVKETLRLHPVTPLLTPRMAKEDCKIAGYDIKEGTRALINMWSIGRDPKLWDNPEEFRPERFLGMDIDVYGHDFRFLPFGSGRRICPGYTHGLKVIPTSLANLLLGFNWELVGNFKREDLDMDEIFGLTTPRKNPLKVVAEPRLPPELYYA